MASIKTETSGSWGDFATKVFLGFMSLSLTMNAEAWLGLFDRFAMPGWLASALLIVTSVLVYGVLQGLLTAAFFAVSLLTHCVQAVAGYAETVTERVLTLVIEYAAQSAMALIALPFRLLLLSASLAYERSIGPLAERKRQRDELRRLYEQVKSDYGSFEEFMRDFQSGFEESATRKKAHADQQRRDQEQRSRRDAPPQSGDPFTEACGVFGLPLDGTFTEADLRQRYGKIIRAVHPDLVGPNALAAQVNQARDIIRKRKGWQ